MFKFILTILIMILFLSLNLKKLLHMLQQNFYNENNRFLKWGFKNLKHTFLNLDLAFPLILAITLYTEPSLNYIIISMFYLIITIIYGINIKKEQVKKKLVVTARVKRLLTTISIIYLMPIIIILINFNVNYLGLYYLILMTLIYLNFIIVYLANIINKPVEKQVFYHYKRQATKKLKTMNHMKIIGITGSYGKTSTKNIVFDILNTKYNPFKTPGNFNTTYGMINSVNNYLDKFSDIYIAEMGAFALGDIKENANLMKPTYGIITSIGKAHLESFGSRENIQKGKFELIESLPANGVGILNKDDEYQRSYKIINKKKIIWISVDDKESDYQATNIKLSNNGTTFDVVTKDKQIIKNLEMKLLGKANIYNVLAGIALAKEFNMTNEEIKNAVKKIKPIEHRLELKPYGKTKHIHIIDDAYNSNPVGSKMALDVLKLMPGKKIVVTPGMIDLGEEQDSLNKEFGNHMADIADAVILVGKTQTKSIYDGLIEKKYKKENIYVINDVKEAFKLMTMYGSVEAYILIENDLPDLFNE